jgi:phytoene dehydrogenase-like protein
VLDGGRVIFLERDVKATERGLGVDGPRYRRLVEPFVRMWPTFVDYTLGSPLRVPNDPVLIGRFGMRALVPASRMARGFRSEESRALLAGNAAHSGLSLEQAPSAAIGLVLMIAGHAVGWPIPRGGSGALTRALASYFTSLGGTIETDTPVTSLDELPPARAVLLSLTHRQVADIAEPALPDTFLKMLREWRYGPGAFKVDWALDAPIPWAAADVARAVTVHIGGTIEEITTAERAPSEGRVAERPFVLLAQPTVTDASRAPDGKHVAWAYCHVPNGWEGDATEAIEAQVERFAPGFRDIVLARATRGPRELESWDQNLVGGDVNGGLATLRQTLARSRWSLDPWSTPVDDLYMCSASTPPGGGVHGMAGYHAARSALRRTFGRR